MKRRHIITQGVAPDEGVIDMPVTFMGILEAALVASSLSFDALTAGFAYGSSKIRIPMSSVHIINGICTGIVAVSMFLGSYVKPYLSGEVALGVSFGVLFIIGLIKLLDSLTKMMIEKAGVISKEVKFKFLNFNMLLRVYAKPEEADFDRSKVLSPAEAALLAISLSLDGAAAGFGAALADVNGVAVVVWSLITNMTFLMAGSYIGKKLAQRFSVNLSWLGGAGLILLAVTKLF